jgi:hypothetical protein
MAFEAAEKLMHQKSLAKMTFHSFPCGALEKLCKEYGLVVIVMGRRPKGCAIKINYIDAIMKFVSQ